MTHDVQIEARAFLVGLARLARARGMSQHAWLCEEEPEAVCIAAGLDPKLLEHVAAFVWTFRKNG